ncbi:stage V sporulation protein AD [Acutalibacter muris]|jgi:stage V sporulation protein AD|uniref:Stage V sporulation protein AD n=1 Tax=Acutalibacter muris TaxID=1796620 RepID=A0A1Z2XT17_9FIRM|nr:stage V sporulation protein AD [Acutalibacter muris]ANU55170.1 stage V sporulation protein AD [Hungateiclostridiaceae bacterium KB18]ASB41596.1 stage V sporulation protein AD [Acutalibacter muris]MCI9192120.1 stage V sporulation protein AD [Acutalibacter muris]MCI9543660.1 stage V sporulation protein AD [Acutalibacter muris]QQR30855.1 stage V sporulation protein AD [Acutalibacter muris]
MKRIGAQTLEFTAPPTVLGHGAVGGRKESEGPLAADFHQTFDDTRLQTDSWEKAEAQLQKEAVSVALAGAGLGAGEVDMIFAGDLLNQCISSTFGLLEYQIPFLGQYGACSTMAQTLLMAGIMVDCGAARRAAAVTSSHFCSAERQFRTPLEYGAQRTPTAQWTATASGCAIVGQGGRVKLLHGLAGKVVDLGVKDPSNMGAAMAPAAADSIYRFLEDTGTAPKDYDGIFTGDLGYVGSTLLLDMLRDNGMELSGVHNDCGLMLFDRQRQDVHAGGSGCGCSASVLCGHLLNRMERGELKNILFCATGALMSTTSQQQGEAIPGVCHIVHLGI